MTELVWDWEVIATALLWKCAPKANVVITRKDLASLPQDRVLIDYRDPAGKYIQLYFATLAQAINMRDKGGAGLSEMQGRWQKVAVVALWKLKRNKPVTLNREDLAPADRLLLIEGFKDDVLLHFVNPFGARKMLEQVEVQEAIR